MSRPKLRPQGEVVERCRSLQESGELLGMFLLHEAGVFAVGKAVERELAARGRA